MPIDAQRTSFPQELRRLACFAYFEKTPIRLPAIKNLRRKHQKQSQIQGVILDSQVELEYLATSS